MNANLQKLKRKTGRRNVVRWKYSILKKTTNVETIPRKRKVSMTIRLLWVRRSNEVWNKDSLFHSTSKSQVKLKIKNSGKRLEDSGVVKTPGLKSRNTKKMLPFKQRHSNTILPKTGYCRLEIITDWVWPSSNDNYSILRMYEVNRVLNVTNVF